MSGLARFGIKPGLDRVRALLESMGNPQRFYPSVHIAGTNGKGSTSTIISNVLSQANYRVGTFTSPHLHSYCERMTIDGAPISLVKLADLLKKTVSGTERCIEMGFGAPTEFEVLTAAALQYFKEEAVDIAVVEAGMGGIHDSTNVINPLVSVITNVRLDHQAYLGHTVDEIAMNKAGIAKPNVPLICGDSNPAVQNVVKVETLARGGQYFSARDLIHLANVQGIGIKGFVLDVKAGDVEYKSVRFALPGRFQLDNLAAAMAALRLLNESGFRVSKSDVNYGLEHVKWPGRLEVINEAPEVIVDAAHNPHGAENVGQALRDIYPERTRVMVVGIVDDKDAEGIIRFLADTTRLCIVTRPDGERGKNWKRLKDIAQRYIKHVETIEDIEDAVKAALGLVKEREYVLITGSFYTLDRARTMFTNPYR
ncbi:MAG: bifunctional folylpolyglutamate synthase/dihydrofolate synthase [Candidatus Saccharibacteria bacterium]